MYLGVWHYIYFFLTFAGLVVATRFAPGIVLRVEATAGLFSRRAFHSSTAELPKFVLLRIALGIILTWRAYDILILLTPGDYSHHLTLLSALVNLLSGIALIIGLFTQWTFIFLIMIQWQQVDWLLGTGTLGNDVAAMLALLLMLTNAGRFYSFDALIIRRWPRLRAWLLYFYAAPTAATINTAKLIGLGSYWLVCLYSLSMHLNEPAWMTGVAGPQLLTNNFMSNYYAPLIHLFEHSQLAVLFARISLWMMLPWYLLLMPAVLVGGAPRRYVIAWGILFFTLSKFVLELGWLAEIEFLFWAGLFWSKTGIVGTHRFAVAFDDTCNLCDRTVQFVRAVDLFDRVELKPASQNKEWLAAHGISYVRAMEDLHGIDERTGRIDAGYDFYIALSKQIVLLWVFYPLLLVGKWLGIGPRVYRFIARRRTDIFGVCKLPSPKPEPLHFELGVDRWQSRWMAIFTLHVFLLGFLYFLAIPAPYVGHAGWSTKLGTDAHMYGITPINVFNTTDLRMMENWFTLDAIEDAQKVRVPLFDENGVRLAYHRSDRVYFGNTLIYRRVTIDSTDCQFLRRQPIIEYLAQVYLARNEKPPGTYNFHYTQYREPIADAKPLRRNRYVRGVKTVQCELDFPVTYP